MHAIDAFRNVGQGIVPVYSTNYANHAIVVVGYTPEYWVI
jgi:hypothetical protein